MGVTRNLEQSKDEQQLAALMRKAQAADAAAYKELLERLAGMAKTFARNALTRAGLEPEQASDDLVQETLLAVHAKRHTYDPSQFFLPWFYAIARHKLIDSLRSAKARRGVVSITGDEAYPELLFDPGEEAASKVDAGQLLSALNPQQRQVLELVKLEGLSVREAAARTGLSESNVKVIVHRAIGKLRDEVGDEQDE